MGKFWYWFCIPRGYAILKEMWKVISSANFTISNLIKIGTAIYFERKLNESSFHSQKYINENGNVFL